MEKKKLERNVEEMQSCFGNDSYANVKQCRIDVALAVQPTAERSVPGCVYVSYITFY